MQIRRIVTQSGALQTQVREPGADWRDSSFEAAYGYASPFRAEWEAETAADAGVHPGEAVLPFKPLSFRDFMLFRDHYVGAARGWTRRFRPMLNRTVAVIERVTRRTFPAYRPPGLWDKEPIYYLSNAQTMVRSGTPVACPPYSSALDWELELGYVINRPLLDATPAEAEAAIGAFVLLNDFSARDVQIPEQNSGFGPQKAKHFLSSLSATAVTPAEILPRWPDLRATVTVNGEIVARPSSSAPRWTLGETIAHASAGEQLRAGEFFGSGTFVGGSGMEIDRWLRPGDQLRLEIDGIGSVEHLIVARPTT